MHAPTVPPAESGGQPSGQPTMDSGIMAAIMTRVRIANGSKPGYRSVRNQKGNIIKSVPAARERELFEWVYAQFGADFANRVSCY